MVSKNNFAWKSIQELEMIDQDNEDFQNCVRYCKSYMSLICYTEVRYEKNSYFLAVMLRYMQLIHGNTYGEQLKEFYKLLREIQKSLTKCGMLKNANSIKTLAEFLETSINNKKEGEGKQFDSLISVQDYPGFQKLLIESGRLIAYYAISKDNGKKYDFIPDVKEIILDSLLDFNKEPESIVFDYLPIGLNCDVYQFNMSTTIGIQKFPIENPEEIRDTFVEKSPIIKEPRTEIHINLLRRRDKYYILYSIQEMEDEQWRIEENTYFFKELIIASSQSII